MTIMNATKMDDHNLRENAAGILLAVDIIADSDRDKQRQVLKVMLEMVSRLESQVHERFDAISMEKGQRELPVSYQITTQPVSKVEA